MADAIRDRLEQGEVSEINDALLVNLSTEIENGAVMNPAGVPLGLALYAGRPGAPGLFFDDGDMRAAIKSFTRPRDGRECIHIVAPELVDPKRQRSFVEKLTAVGDAVKNTGAYKDSYVRYISEQRRDMLLQSGRWGRVDNSNGWIENCPHEDEEYPQLLVRLKSQDLPVQLSYNSSENLRKVTNRLKKGDKVFCWKPLEDFELAVGRIAKHFENIQKEREVVGSCALDYELLCRTGAKLQGRKGVFALVGYLNDEPVSVFICQQYAPGEVAVFSSITLRERGTLQNLPLYVFMELFSYLRDRKVETVNLLGCETESLFDYKRKFGDETRRSTWAIYR